MSYTLSLCLLLCAVFASLPAPTNGQINVACLPGVLPIVDSEHRDRWGIDGYHAANINDGITAAEERQAWASDNWEVTHAAVLVFPQRVLAEKVTFAWWNNLTPRRAVLQGWSGGQWKPLARLDATTDGSNSTLTFPAVVVEAVRLVQPPEGANPRADRRLWIGEMEVFGATTAEKVDTAQLAGRIRAEMRQLRQREDAARVKPQIDLVMRRPKTRGFQGIIDAEDVKRGRANVAKRPWAKALADTIFKDADWWLQQPDDYLRSLVPVGNPRAICPQFEKGCPIHGGARMSFDTTLETPYRWRCKQGGEWWYDGAKVKNPTTGEEVTVHDDGSGWLAPPGFPNAGRRYFFVAAYRYYLLGKLFSYPYEPDSGASKYEGGTPIVQLALAYALSGDARYAHKAGVLLTRLADLYPTYDGCIEGPSQRQDGYIGQTFERFLAQNLILACDLIWDALDAAQREHLQHNLLAYIYEYLHRLMPYFDGDFLMYEMTALAGLAHILDNPDLAAEALESDTGLRVMLTNSWFRDGKFIYDSCGYNVGNAQAALLIGEWLHGFTAPPRYPKPLDLYNQPDYRMSALFDFLRDIDCDGRVPQIGDVGGSRDKSLRLTPPYSLTDERALLRLPAQRDFYAARLSAAASGNLETYRKGNADWWLLFHAEEPLPVTPAPPPAPVPHSRLFEDSGIAVLRAGASPATRQHVALTFSKGRYGHGHADKLAIDILRYGYDLSADLGYPTTWTDIKYGGWETNTASHGTVMLDEKEQSGDSIGALDFYATLPMVDVVEASAEKAAYPQSSLYRRTVALVRDDRGEPLYTFDVFRVAGAMTRDYLFHSLGRPEDLTVTLRDKAVSWQAQLKGSLAGEDVAPMTAGGYGFLFDVQRAPFDAGGVATWHTGTAASGDQAGLALHLLGAPGREIIRAKAEGYGLRGKSPLEGHIVVRDRAANSSDAGAFVAVFEAFQDKTRVIAIDAVPLTPASDVSPDGRVHPKAVAVRVQAGDRVDYLFSALDAVPRTAQIDGLRIEFSGRFGLAAVRAGKVTALACVGGSIACGGQRAEAPPTVRGRILHADPENNVLTVRVRKAGMKPLPGEHLLVRNEGFVAPAVYEIRKVEVVDAVTWKLSVNMPLTLARGTVAGTDAAKGAFASRTPVMKLRVNPGLFNGKRVRPRLTDNAPESLLTSAQESAFVLADAKGLTAFSPGGEYVVLDVGAGDDVEILGSAQQSVP